MQNAVVLFRFYTVFNLLLLWLHLKCAKKSRLQEVNLDGGGSFLSWWKIVHFDPQERLEYEGQPVPVSFYCNVMVKSSSRHKHFTQFTPPLYFVFSPVINRLLFFFPRPMWRCSSYTARQTRLLLFWVMKSFGIFLFSFKHSHTVTVFKVQCIRFRGIYWQNMAEIEYNIHKYIFMSV